MIISRYSVRCQGVRCNKEAESGETKRESLQLAKAEGFRRVKVPNGTMWDFCPACYEKTMPCINREKGK